MIKLIYCGTKKYERRRGMQHDLVQKEGANDVLSVFILSTIGLISQVSTPMKDDKCSRAVRKD